MTLLARGWSASGDRWELDVAGDAREFRTSLHVTTAEGRKSWGLGTSGPADPGRHRMDTTWGRNDVGPAEFIARLTPDVRAVVVTLSDGTRDDLTLYGDPAVWGARIAVLVYPRDLDIHRIDLFGRDGSPIVEMS